MHFYKCHAVNEKPKKSICSIAVILCTWITRTSIGICHYADNHLLFRNDASYEATQEPAELSVIAQPSNLSEEDAVGIL